MAYLYELRAARDAADAVGLDALCRRWAEAIAAVKARDYATAARLFTALADERPGDRAARRWALRTRAHADNPPLTWNGARYPRERPPSLTPFRATRTIPAILSHDWRTTV